MRLVSGYYTTIQVQPALLGFLLNTIDCCYLLFQEEVAVTKKPAAAKPAAKDSSSSEEDSEDESEDEKVKPVAKKAAPVATKAASSSESSEEDSDEVSLCSLNVPLSSF